MSEKDLVILEKILKELGYSTNYIVFILEYLVQRFSESRLSEVTPQFIYVSLVPEEGRSKARDIADYFEEFKEKGSFRTKIQRYLDSSPYMK
jgi:hypothetical protein